MLKIRIIPCLDVKDGKTKPRATFYDQQNIQNRNRLDSFPNPSDEEGE